jgi:hypothetical protein
MWWQQILVFMDHPLQFDQTQMCELGQLDNGVKVDEEKGDITLD